MFVVYVHSKNGQKYWNFRNQLSKFFKSNHWTSKTIKTNGTLAAHLFQHDNTVLWKLELSLFNFFTCLVFLFFGLTTVKVFPINLSSCIYHWSSKRFYLLIFCLFLGLKWPVQISYKNNLTNWIYSIPHSDVYRLNKNR